MEIRIQQDGYNLIDTFSLVVPSDGMISVDINGVSTGVSNPAYDYIGIDFIFGTDDTKCPSINIKSNIKEDSPNPNRCVVSLYNFTGPFASTSSKPLLIATLDGNQARKIYIHFFLAPVNKQQTLICSVFWKDEQ